jgi:hypothetical protein
MDAYCSAIRKMEGKFYRIEYHHMVRDKNQAVNQLSKLGSSRAKIPPGVFVQDLKAPSVEDKSEVEETPPAEQLALAISTSASHPPARLQHTIHGLETTLEVINKDQHRSLGWTQHLIKD